MNTDGKFDQITNPDKVDPVDAKRKPPLNVEEWFAKLDEFNSEPFPDREQPDLPLPRKIFD